MFQHALYDPAAIRMSGVLANLAMKGVDDELNVLCWDSFNGFLDNMIAVLILDTSHHIMLELLDKLGLLVSKDVLESLRLISWGNYDLWD